MEAYTSPVPREYRDELSAAQERIASLERENGLLRAGVDPGKTSFPWAWVLLPLLVVTSFSVAAFAIVRARTQAPPAPSDSLPIVEPTYPVTHNMYFYTGGDSGPTVLDVDGDGRKEIVSLLWGGSSDKSLYVAALDRETFAEKWVAGPYASQWNGDHTHLVLTGKHAVLSDSRATLHVLDLADGKEVQSTLFLAGARFACATSDGQRVKVAPDLGGESARVLDPETGALGPLPKGEGADCWTKTCDEKHPKDGCLSYDPRAGQKSKLKGFSSYTAQLAGPVRLAPGTVERKGEPGYASLLAVDKKTGAFAWETPELVDGDKLHLAGRIDRKTTAELVISFYQRVEGDFRIVARKTSDGSEAFRLTLSQAVEGSYVGSLDVQDGELFVFVDHTLHVVDLTSGQERKVVSTL